MQVGLAWPRLGAFPQFPLTAEAAENAEGKGKDNGQERVHHREHGEHREKIVERNSNKKYVVVSFSIFTLCSLW